MWTISLFGQVLYEIERGFVRPIGTMQTQRRRRAAIKENIPQRYPLGQRFGYGTRAPLRKTFLRNIWLYGQSAAGSRFLSGGRSSYDGHTEGDLQTLANTCSTEEKAQSYGSQPLWAVLLWAAGRGRSALLQTAVFPCGGRKRKESLCASFWSSTVPT